MCGYYNVFDGSVCYYSNTRVVSFDSAAIDCAGDGSGALAVLSEVEAKNVGQG